MKRSTKIAGGIVVTGIIVGIALSGVHRHPVAYIPHPKIGIYFISSNGSGTTVMVRIGGIVKVLSGIPTAVKMASKVG